MGIIEPLASDAPKRRREAWTFDFKKPEKGLILAGGECGPIGATIFLGNDNYVKSKLRKKAAKIQAYLKPLLSVVKQEAKAYHVERLAFRDLKYTARARAQYFLVRVFAPEITEEASRVVHEAVKNAEVALLGRTEEVEKAQGQACLAFDFGGQDMQPRTGCIWRLGWNPR